MTDEARANLHSNTAKMMSHVNYPVIQKKFLAQIYNVAPEYAQAVYDTTTYKHGEKFEFSEVEKLSKDAHMWYKEPMLRPDADNRLVGFAPANPFYH